jgi:hypothetical protein
MLPSRLLPSLRHGCLRVLLFTTSLAALSGGASHAHTPPYPHPHPPPTRAVPHSLSWACCCSSMHSTTRRGRSWAAC